MPTPNTRPANILTATIVQTIGIVRQILLDTSIDSYGLDMSISTIVAAVDSGGCHGTVLRGLNRKLFVLYKTNPNKNKVKMLQMCQCKLYIVKSLLKLNSPCIA